MKEVIRMQGVGKCHCDNSIIEDATFKTGKFDAYGNMQSWEGHAKIFGKWISGEFGVHEVYDNEKDGKISVNWEEYFKIQNNE